MKTVKILIALVLAVCAVTVIYFAQSAKDSLPGLLETMDAQQLAAQDDKMLKARDRVTDALEEGDREKTLRNLTRYLDGFSDKLTFSDGVNRELMLFKNYPVLTAGSIFLLAIALALVVYALDKGKKFKKLALPLVLIAALYCGIYIVENITGVNSMLMTVLKKGAIYALIAVSMNLLNGFTGLFSLGQAGFMLIGAYAYAILSIPVENRAQVYQYYAGGLIQFSLPPLLSIVIAGLAAAFFAFLIGLPVLRLKSDYLAIATLGFAEIIRAVFQSEGLGPITNGSNLLRRFTVFSTALYPFAIAGVCIALITLLIHSTYGRAFKAIRDDEVAAEAMGINLFAHKQLAFVISSFFAGVGGALLAMYQTTVQAAAFTSAMTYEILLIVVIGGMGSISGSVIASFLFVAASEWWLRFLDNETMIGSFQVPLLRSGFRMVAFSVVIMAVVLFYRKGIMGDKEFSLARMIGWTRRRKEAHDER